MTTEPFFLECAEGSCRRRLFYLKLLKCNHDVVVVVLVVVAVVVFVFAVDVMITEARKDGTARYFRILGVR